MWAAFLPAVARFSPTVGLQWPEVAVVGTIPVAWRPTPETIAAARMAEGALGPRVHPRNGSKKGLKLVGQVCAGSGLLMACMQGGGGEIVVHNFPQFFRIF